MSAEPTRFNSLCLLLHNLLAGGSARQWLNLLGPAAAAGTRVTIVAPPGPLAASARAAGIDLVEVDWATVGTALDQHPWPRVSEHEVAVVHWDHQVMNAFTPALEACGRAALVIHQSPTALARWFGDGIVELTRAPVELAVRHPAAVAMVRGEHHRRRFVDAFGLPPEGLRILPAAIPTPPVAGTTADPATGEVLAMIRLSPDKAAVARMAVALVAGGRAAGDSPRLTIAGDGPWRESARALCESALPAGSWRLEPAPHDPLARLAAADLVVAQGLTTLEAAALGRPTVVAREAGENGAAGIALRPENYGEAAQDPFGFPAVSTDSGALWHEARALTPADLAELRALVIRHNSIEACRGALEEALAATAPGLPAWRRDAGPL